MPLVSIQLKIGSGQRERQTDDGWLTSKVAVGQEQLDRARRHQMRFWIGVAVLAFGVCLLLLAVYVASIIASGVENGPAQDGLSGAVVSYLRAVGTGDSQHQSVSSAALTLAQSEVQKQQSFAASAITLIAGMAGIVAAILVWLGTTLTSASRARGITLRRAATALALAQDPKNSDHPASDPVGRIQARDSAARRVDVGLARVGPSRARSESEPRSLEIPIGSARAATSALPPRNRRRFAAK